MNKDLILCSALLDKNISEDLKSSILNLPDECFYEEAYQIFKCIKDGKDITSAETEHLEKVVSILDTPEYKAFSGSSRHVQNTTIEAVLNKYKSLKALSYLDQFTIDIINSPDKIKEALNKFVISTAKLPSTERPISMSEACAMSLKEIEDSINGVTDTIISTGYRNLDDALSGGIGSGDIITLTAKSGRGKTTFVQNLLYNITNKYPNKSILYLTTEMTPTQVQQKFACMVAGYKGIQGLSIDRIRQAKKFGSSVYNAMIAVSGELEKLNVDFQWIRDPKNLDLYLNRKDYDIVCVDHIHDFDGMLSKNAEEVTGQIMNTLKTWTVSEPNRICLVLAQPRKSDNSSANKDSVDSADDIKGSQAIQSNAAVVLIATPNFDDCTTNISIKKNRWGQSNRIVQFKFNPQSHIMEAM